MLLFVVVIFTPLPNVLAARLVVPPQIEGAEAIVVLGAGLESPRTLSLLSLRRTVHGIRLYRQGLAAMIVFSGGRSGEEGVEGSVMASLAQELGVPSTAIWTETQSNDTWTEALEVAKLAHPRGIRTILLVTDPFHMRRARAAFERVGFRVLPAGPDPSLDDASKPEIRLGLMRQVCQEALARAYYWVRSRL
jgi:uncharacterized SAM-binding protein YcdF (DUF218 family)